MPRTKRTRVTEVRNLMGMMTGGTFKGRMERGESEPIQNIVILPKIFPDKYRYIALYNI